MTLAQLWWGDPSSGRLKYTLVVVVFFLVPVIAGVIGLDTLHERDWRFRAGLGRESWRWRSRIWLRMLMWFLGAALTTPILWLLIHGKWPV